MNYPIKVSPVGHSKAIIIPAFYYRDTEDIEIEFDVTENEEYRLGTITLKTKKLTQPEMKERSKNVRRK